MTDRTCTTLIVGASQAGVQLATSLRDHGDDASILLVGGEQHPPYQRPPLSKAFLTGKASADSLTFRTPQWYADKRIELRLGTMIEQVELDGRSAGSGVATTRAGEHIDFDRLALTVGGRARRLQLPGVDLDGVLYLRQLAQADELRTRLASAHHLVVVGGGFIGLEAAAAATAAGVDTTVVDVADRLLGRAVAPVVSDFYLRAHQRRGTKVLLETGITAIEGTAQHGVCGVRLSDGRTIEADTVLIGVGLEPRTELAEQLGLEVDRGIVVDAAARTSIPAIVAAGDCTTLPHPITGKGRLRIESVQNAVWQAQVAAATLLGLAAGSGAHAVPWFWSDQADLKLQIAGLSQDYDQVVVRGEPDSEAFSVLYYAGGKLIAIDAVNNTRDYLVARKLIGLGASVPPERAGDPSVSLKDLAAAVA